MAYECMNTHIHHKFAFDLTNLFDRHGAKHSKTPQHHIMVCMLFLSFL